MAGKFGLIMQITKLPIQRTAEGKFMSYYFGHRHGNIIGLNMDPWRLQIQLFHETVKVPVKLLFFFVLHGNSGLSRFLVQTSCGTPWPLLDTFWDLKTRICF